MGIDHGNYAHWCLPKSGITMLFKALVTGLIGVQTLSVRIRDITCDGNVVTNVPDHIGPNQASCFQCRFTSKKQHFVCYPTHKISNAKQAQTQCISISLLFKSAALLQAAACCRYLIPALTRGSHLYYVQCSISRAWGHHAVAEGAATGQCHWEGVKWPGEMEAFPR